jgi:hypothetical protein
VGAKVLPHIADALGRLGVTIARYIPEIDRYADGVDQNVGRALNAVPLVKGFASGLRRAGLAAVNVVQTAYNAVQAITNALMAANSVGLVVIALAALAAGFVLAYNKLKPFHDAVNTAFVLLKELWSWLWAALALCQLQHRA